MADRRLVAYRKSARNLNMINRTLQSTSEKLERWLDRARVAKRVDPMKVKATAVPLFDAMKERIREEERALTDLLGIAAS